MIKCPHDIPFTHTDCNFNCCGCSKTQPVDQVIPYPSAGWVRESFFMMCNGIPFLCDNTQDSYGSKLSYSENVVTRIHRREDVSCVNLQATFAMVDSTYTNTVRKHYLTQTIKNQHATNNGVVNVMKHVTKFILKFHVEDECGGTVYSNEVFVPCQNRKLHYTDVEDLLITSFKNLFTVHIPAMDYSGMYTLVLDQIRATTDYVETEKYVEEGMNPLYQFTDNNTKIYVQHDAVDTAVADGYATIATLDLGTKYPFQANLTTRLRLSFVAYMCNTILESDTFEVWDALNDTSAEVIRQMQEEINTLKEQMEESIINIDNLDLRVESLENSETKLYEQGEEYTTGCLVYLVPGQLYQATKDFTSDDTEGNTPEQSMLADISAGNITPVITI